MIENVHQIRYTIRTGVLYLIPVIIAYKDLNNMNDYVTQSFHRYLAYVRKVTEKRVVKKSQNNFHPTSFQNHSLHSNFLIQNSTNYGSLPCYNFINDIINIWLRIIPI